jgi:hypothetical protein
MCPRPAFSHIGREDTPLTESDSLFNKISVVVFMVKDGISGGLIL